MLLYNNTCHVSLFGIRGIMSGMYTGLTRAEVRRKEAGFFAVQRKQAHLHV